MRIAIRDIDAVKGGRIAKTDIIVEDGKFTEKSGSCDREIDGRGLLAVPGFIDTHIHGIGGCGTEDGDEDSILTMSSCLAAAGVTSFFPTIYTDTMERILKDERAIVQAHGKEKGASIAGIHIEGPFISPRRIGAQNPAGRLDPSPSAMEAMIAEGCGLTRAMTAAPELEGIREIAKIAEKHGIVMLMGHTDASYEEASAGIKMGFRHAAHLFNAMSGINHRKPGTAGCILMHDEMTAEIIADGRHVHPDLVKFVIRTKGADKVAVITDSLRPTMQREGKLTANGVEVEMKDGLWVTKDNPELIQGSALTMHRAFVNLINWGIPVEEASMVTSSAPARIYGLSDRGEIAAGKRADLAVMDRNLEIRFTMVNGGIVCGTAS